MEKEKLSSNGQGDDKQGNKPAQGAQNNGAKSGTPAKSKIKTRQRKKKEIKPEVWVAIISAIATIIGALIGYKSNHPEPTPTPIPTSTIMPSSTPFFTTTSIVFTDTPSPTILPSLTSTISTTVVPPETMTLMPQPKLIVLLTANKSSGHAPLKVKIDARESYLTAYDGQKYVCRNGPCNYIWKVYFNEQQVGKSENNSGGTFDYTFGKRGTYKVTVWVCRGRDKVDCGGGGIQITAT
jgi:hypothetical protein